MATGRYYTPDLPRFSRRWWLATARNLFWVAVVTILIWVFADLQFTNTADLSVMLRLTAGGSKDLVLLDRSDMEKRDVKVTFKARGSQGRLNNYKEQLKSNENVISYDLTRDYGAGEHTISVADLLKRTEGIRQAGLTVLSASSAPVIVRLDRALYVPDVEVVFRGRGATYSDAEVTPARMGFTVSETLWKEFGKTNPELRTVTKDLSNERTDRPIPVAIEPYVEGIPVRPDRKEVTVRVQVGTLTGEKPIPVTVRLLVPQTWAEDGTWEKYRLVLHPTSTWVQRITVWGPKTALEKLEAKDVDAYIVLNEGDKSPLGSYVPKEVTIWFRGDTENELKLVGKPPSVSVRLSPRSPASTTP
ncbi:MAG TPA: hypothetical protein VM389_07895 [Phycisphaerae bacterium]|nr:hypothetical protein [Phycisphaerae bacterium]